MDLGTYLVAELDDTANRLNGQVLDIVPIERQKERMPGGNSVIWATYHVARHARLALQVAGAAESGVDPRLADFADAAIVGGSGLQEREQPWAVDFDPIRVREYANAVVADVRTFVSGLTAEALDERPDVQASLVSAGIETDGFGWLYQMWGGQSLAFLVRWPLIGHITNHVGEMISTRNQMGLSPFR